MASGRLVTGENVRDIIFSLEGTVYFVSKMLVENEENGLLTVVLTAKRLETERMEELRVSVPPGVVEVVGDYVRRNEYDLLLVIVVQNKAVHWAFVSDSWLKRQLNAGAMRGYVV